MSPDRLIVRLAAALLVVASPFAATAASKAPLAPFAARYDVLRNGDVMGTATITLADAGDGTWTLRTETDGTKGLASLAGAHIDEASTFRWHDGRPELVRYRYEQKVGWRSKTRALDLDAARRTIAADDGRRRGDVPFEAGLQDRHTVVLAIAADLSAGRDDFSYRVVDKLAIDEQRYASQGTDTIDTPAGSFRAARVERQRSKPGRTTTSWLVPALGYLPARIVQREPDGETIEMRLVSH